MSAKQSKTVASNPGGGTTTSKDRPGRGRARLIRPSKYSQQAAEVETFLSATDQARSIRTRPHHLHRSYYSSPDTGYCVTLCARRHGLPFESPQLAGSVIQALRGRHERHETRTFAYCLMPDHLHWVFALPVVSSSSPDTETNPNSVFGVLRRFKSETIRLAWDVGLVGRLWQKDFYDHIARGSQDLVDQCLYALENPVRKGLCATWDEYSWSGIQEEWRDLYSETTRPGRGDRSID